MCGPFLRHQGIQGTYKKITAAVQPYIFLADLADKKLIEGTKKEEKKKRKKKEIEKREKKTKGKGKEK